MSQKNETLPLILALLITAGILGGGFWWYKNKFGVNLANVNSNSGNQTPPTSSNDFEPPINVPSGTSVKIDDSTSSNDFKPPINVPSGTSVKIDGSTSMVQINQGLKNSFEQQFPGSEVITNARGSGKGVEELLAGNLDLAAISRPLKSQEEAQGLVAVPVAKDAIAIVIGINNPFRKSLTQQQVRQIFQGDITNWSEVGGNSETIKVINRPTESGTRQVFQELVLQGNNFGTNSNIETAPVDATTPILRALENNGIGYATFTQIISQSTVRAVPIEGLTPEASSYPYQRTLFYVYQEPANPAVKAFLGYLKSPKGQQVLSSVN